MAEVVSHRSVTADARIWFQVRKYGISGGQIDTGTGFSLSKRFSPVNIILPMLHAHSIYFLNLPEGQRQEAWKPSGKMLVRKSARSG